MIMRPERVIEEHLDPCLVQRGCRYDEAPLRECVRVTENASPHPRAGVRNRCADEYGSRLVVRYARAIRCDWHRDHRQAYRPGTSTPSIRRARLAHEQGPSRRVRFEMIRNHQSDAPAAFGASYGCTHLFTEHISCPSRRHSAIKPAIAPIH